MDEKYESEPSEKCNPILNEISRTSTQNDSDETQRVNAILQEICSKKVIFRDEKDESTHPSYTNFKVPYQMICQLRYSQKKAEYERQFQHEIHQMLNHQPTAYDAARFNRHMCVTTLWPPLHNRKEIDYFQNNFFRLSHKKKKRLDFLMNTKVS